MILNIKQQTRIKVTKNRQTKSISYKYTDFNGENIMFIRVSKNSRILFDSHGYLVDDTTWVKGVSSKGKFDGLVSVKKDGITVRSVNKSEAYFYEDIKYLEVVRRHLSNGVISIKADTRKYYY